MGTVMASLHRASRKLVSIAFSNCLMARLRRQDSVASAVLHQNLEFVVCAVQFFESLPSRIGCRSNVSMNADTEELVSSKVVSMGRSSHATARGLLDLRQGRRSVCDFSIEFHILGSKSWWVRVALRDTFLHGLADEIKDALVSHELLTISR